MPAARVSPVVSDLPKAPVVSAQRSSVSSASRHCQISSQSQSQSGNESFSSECSDNCSSDNTGTGSTNSLITNLYHSSAINYDNGLTPYERVLRSLNSDERWQREITLGRRIGFYRFRGEIGTGNFSQVKVAMHCLTKERVAVKILDKCKLDSKTQRMLSREIASMELLHHPNVIRIFEVIDTLSKIYLVMEYAYGGELFQRISTEGRIVETEAKNLFAQIVSAIDHMHQHKIIHRDIKAENVFFSDAKTVKVGDFGFSTNISTKDELLSTFCGSPPYAAPELFHDESYLGPYVDYWALGILLYFMVSATMPFKAQTISALKKLILDGEYDIPEHLTPECVLVIRGLLHRNPHDRLDLDALRHTSWLMNEIFPKCLPKYKLQPSTHSPVLENHNDSVSHKSLSNDEREAINEMKDLGIDDTMIRDTIDKGSRSNVTGTYRIILHRIINSKYTERLNSYHQRIYNGNTSGKSKSIPKLKNNNSKETNGNVKSGKLISKSLKSVNNNHINDKSVAPVNGENGYNTMSNGIVKNKQNAKSKWYRTLTKVRIKKSKTCVIL